MARKKETVTCISEFKNKDETKRKKDYQTKMARVISNSQKKTKAL